MTREPDEKTAGYEFLASELVKRDAKIERLRALSQNNAHSWDAIVRERDGLRADNERLRALVKDALRGLHNDFEPDNQSALYNRIKAALEPKP